MPEKEDYVAPPPSLKQDLSHVGGSLLLHDLKKWASSYWWVIALVLVVFVIMRMTN
ncbi:MAG: hypothetical protein KAW41_01215 [Candidatus Diapherotrites archaeon]|nr:hypothetical protein [Candidatus Diapherotrites archaeon]